MLVKLFFDRTDRQGRHKRFLHSEIASDDLVSGTFCVLFKFVETPFKLCQIIGSDGEKNTGIEQILASSKAIKQIRTSTDSVLNFVEVRVCIVTVERFCSLLFDIETNFAVNLIACVTV